MSDPAKELVKEQVGGSGPKYDATPMGNIRRIHGYLRQRHPNGYPFSHFEAACHYSAGLTPKQRRRAAKKDKGGAA